VEHGLKEFFPEGIAYEPRCEPYKTCTTDMLSFKGYVHRWYSTITKVAPFLEETILPVLKTSAEAAVKQCTGGENQRECGYAWSSGVFDGSIGAGQEMNVVGAVSSLLIAQAPGPVTASNGGTSKGDTNAGTEDDDDDDRITTSDRAGAAIITIMIIGCAVSMFGWMSFGQ
jgi:mannan endo-1,6-alpha-mannosidase